MRLGFAFVMLCYVFTLATAFAQDRDKPRAYGMSDKRPPFMYIENGWEDKSLQQKSAPPKQQPQKQAQPQKPVTRK